MKAHLKIINDDLKVISTALKPNLNKISGSTFLITGASGLLASYMVDTLAFINDHKLVEKPCKIICVCRSPVEATSRLGHLLGRKDVSFIIHDVAKRFPIKQPIDYIIHAAGNSTPASFQSDPLGTIDVNVKGLRWLLEHAKKTKSKSVLYFSSGEIYGNPTKDNYPTSENYNGNVSTLAPRACYTEAKRLSEVLCSVYYKKYGVPAKIVRPFIVYGPGLLMTDHRVMSDFMRLGLQGTPIQMLNQGQDTRSYCYITDATPLFFKVLFSDANVDPVNVASDLEEVSIRQLAETVHRLCKIKCDVSVKPSEKSKFVADAPSRVCPDISKARKLFGYKPKVNLKQGLARTLEWNRAFFHIKKDK